MNEKLYLPGFIPLVLTTGQSSDGCEYLRRPISNIYILITGISGILIASEAHGGLSGMTRACEYYIK